MAELGTLEAMAVQGALKAMLELRALGTMAELGALGTMADMGALGTMAELGALKAMADGLWGPWPRPPRPGPYSRNPNTPKKNFPGEVRGYQEPSRARQPGQDTMTGSPPGPDRQDIPQRQESPPGPDRQDRTSHRNQKPSWASSEAEASSGHDQESGALTGSLSDRLHFSNKGAGRLEWPPWPQHEEPPAPDESPWTRQDMTWWFKCSCGHNKTDTRHSWPWHVDLIHGARDSGDQRAWINADPVGLSQRQSGGLESAAIWRAWVSGNPAGFETVWKCLFSLLKKGVSQ